MVSTDLGLLRVRLLLDLDLGGNLSRSRIELMVHDLVVVDQGRSVRATTLSVDGVVTTAWRVEKRSAKLLAAWGLAFVILAIFHALGAGSASVTGRR